MLSEIYRVIRIDIGDYEAEPEAWLRLDMSMLDVNLVDRKVVTC